MSNIIICFDTNMNCTIFSIVNLALSCPFYILSCREAQNYICLNSLTLLLFWVGSTNEGFSHEIFRRKISHFSTVATVFMQLRLSILVSPGFQGDLLEITHYDQPANISNVDFPWIPS